MRGRRWRASCCSRSCWRPPPAPSSSFHQLDNELVLGVLGVLAMAGIFFVVSALIGFIEIMPQAAGSDERPLLPRFIPTARSSPTRADVLRQCAPMARSPARGVTRRCRRSKLCRRATATPPKPSIALTNGLHEAREGAEEALGVQKAPALPRGGQQFRRALVIG